MKTKSIPIGMILSGLALASHASPEAKSSLFVPWNECLRQEAEWYQSQEASRIADQVLLFQLDTGGWPKNIDMAAPLSEKERKNLLEKKQRQQDSTIDNGATYTQMTYLARVYRGTRLERYKEAFLKGLDFLLNIQYENGGWPQSPYLQGYPLHITFNDNAMTGVLRLLRDIARNPSDYVFVDEIRRAKADAAVRKGIECVLQCQVIVEGRPTVWCAQHDEKTLRPAPARAYEKISLSGSESADVVRLLMEIDNPPPRIVHAVQSAVAWFEQVKITGLRQITEKNPALPRGYDKVIIADPGAPPLWARFYEIGTNRPIFCGRDDIIKYSLAEIDPERRTGYSWYTESPASLLARDYPRWSARWIPKADAPNPSR